MICVTGESGYIGSALLLKLEALSLPVCAIGRSPTANRQSTKNYFSVPDYSKIKDFGFVFKDVDVVIHTAARVHIMRDTLQDPLYEYRRVNVEGTLKLAEEAARNGVKRFIFLSSIKVNGERTLLGKPFSPADMPSPKDSYGISKLEAEEGLYKIAAETGLEVVVIRPPLVYGSGVKANFSMLMNWLDRGIPLPLGAADCNLRSFVALDNLIDLIVTCIRHPSAANQTFLVSDDEDLSTRELLIRMGNVLGRPARLYKVPLVFLTLAARLLSRRDLSNRLLGNLQLDISKTKNILGWSPPVSVHEGLSQVAAATYKKP